MWQLTLTTDVMTIIVIWHMHTRAEALTAEMEPTSAISSAQFISRTVVPYMPTARTLLAYGHDLL